MIIKRNKFRSPLIPCPECSDDAPVMYLEDKLYQLNCDDCGKIFELFADSEVDATSQFGNIKKAP